MDELNNSLLDITEDSSVVEESEKAIVPIVNTIIDKKGRKKREKTVEKRHEVFAHLATLLNKTENDVIDDCVLYQVKKIMSRLGKLIARYNVKDQELEKILVNAITLKMDEVVISPAYVPACKKKVKKLSLENQKVSAFIDFPFGESSFKSKLTDIKDCIKAGVDGVMVMLPTMLLASENVKTFKQQTKKIARLKQVEKGIAIAASDVDKEQIKTAIKLVERTNLDYITFAFGNSPEADIIEKFEVIKKYKGKKQVKALGNVRTSEGAVEIIKLGADKILTPYADEIGEDLVSRFKIKGVKLR